MRAFAELLEARQRDGALAEAPSCALVLAGGYDKRLAENREHFVEVQRLVAELGLQEQVRPHCRPCVCFVCPAIPLRARQPFAWSGGWSLMPLSCVHVQHLMSSTVPIRLPGCVLTIYTIHPGGAHKPQKHFFWLNLFYGSFRIQLHKVFH